MTQFKKGDLSAVADFQLEGHRKRVGALAQELDRDYYRREGITLLNTAESVSGCSSFVRQDRSGGPLQVGSPGLSCIGPVQSEKVVGDRVALATEIVRLANAFDEMMEWLPFEYQGMDNMLDELASMNELGLWRPQLEATLSKLSRDLMPAALSAGDSLPVSALSAVRKMAAVPVASLTVETLLMTAANDPVLAADLLRVVNSWAFPLLLHRISSLKDAVLYLGIEKVRTVLLSSSSRALFGSGTVRGLWKHSVQVASMAADLGAVCGCDPDDAFIAGLLHDVGRLAIEKLDQETLARRARLLEQDLPVVWVDLLTCRHDHAEIGGALMEKWNLPLSVVEAVSLHHAPERTESKLAAVLYLAELRAGQESGEMEDLPSALKTAHALTTSGLSIADVQRTGCPEMVCALLAS